MNKHLASPIATTDAAYPETPARRRWLRSLSAASVVCASLPSQGLFSSALLAYLPSVFDVTDHRALVGIIGLRAATVHVRWGEIVGKTTTPTLKHRSETFSLAELDAFSGAIELTGLPDAARVAYAVFRGDERVSDVQQFRSAPHRQSRHDVVLAFSGDMEERYKPFHIFDRIAAHSPDVFLHLGDTVYADIPKRDFSPTLAHYRRKHAAIRDDQSLQRFLGSCTTIAIWDDHEIENDANSTHPAMEVAEKAFREFWPTRPAALLKGGERNTGLYRASSFGQDIELFVLDTRRFRSPQSEHASEQKTMLGATQRRWFQTVYRASRARYRIVATSVPFHGASKDAWGNYANERDQLLAMFREAHASDGVKTVILSADYHFAREWPRNEKRGVYEFMAGPLAAFLTFERDNGARERHTRGEHFVYGDGANFGVLRYDANERELRISYYDGAGTMLHTRLI